MGRGVGEMGAVISSEGFLSEMRTESGPPTISEKGSHGTESESELGGALWERGSAARPHLDLGLAGSPLLLGPTPPSHPISKQRAVLGCVTPSKLQSFTALSGEGFPPHLAGVGPQATAGPEYTVASRDARWF